MAGAAKANSDRIGAVAAFANAVFFLVGLALVANMFANANTDLGEAATAQACLWVGRLLALPMPLAIAVSYFAMARRHKPGWRTIATAAPGFIVAAFCVWLGWPLTAMGEQAVSTVGGPVDGAFAMGVAFMGFFVWMLFVGATLAALIAVFGVARGLGDWPLLLGPIAALLGFLSFSFLGFVAMLALAAWWGAVAVGLWRAAPAGP